jgi:hypothetical protein
MLNYLGMIGCPRHQKHVFMNDRKGNSWIKARREGDVQMIIPCRSMESIFDEANVTLVDFFSLDVERAEATVLGSINFEKVKFGVVIVENVHHDPAIDKILIEKAGLIKLSTDGTGVAACHPAAKLRPRY